MYKNTEKMYICIFPKKNLAAFIIIQDKPGKNK